jgi:uncharacterized membrane protein HdeD (DUF308 family)
MKKNIPIYLYGAIIILEGIFLIFSEYNTFKIIKLTTGVSLIVSAIVAFIVVFSRQKKQVQFAYHLMHALAMLVFGISILMFCNTFEKLVSFTSFLFFFYSFSEIIFCFWLFNLGQKIVYKIIIVRFLLGLAIGIGTLVAMNFSTFTLEGFGILFIMMGINIMLYVPVMKVKESNEIQYLSKAFKR